MIAYNKETLANTFHAHGVEAMAKEGLVVGDEKESILQKLYPKYKSNPIFIRIAIFFLTVFVTSSGLGIFATAIFQVAENYGFYLIFSSIILFISLHLFAIKSQNFFGGGMDDALLYYALTMLISGIVVGFETYDYFDVLGHCLMITPIVAIATILYFDRLLALISFVLVGITIFYLSLELGVWGKILMPFIIMAYSIAIWKLTIILEANVKLFIWIKCIVWVKWASMILLAWAGNYFIVRELGSLLLESPISSDQGIPLGWFFYLFTFVLPISYVFFGLKNKNLALLNIGLFFIVVAVSTIQNYYPLDVEWLLIIGGLLLGAISFFAHKYLKEDKHGITLMPSVYLQADGAKAEAAIIQQNLNIDLPPPTIMGDENFGGGSFGGGGTGGGF